MALAVTQNVIASSANRVVLGLGVTGLSCARHLYRNGESFSVIDTRSHPPGLTEMEQEMPDVAVYAGDYPAAVLESAAEVISVW